MADYNTYRTIRLELDGANTWIPEVRLSAGDVNGRRLQVVLKDDDTLLEDASKLVARLTYDPYNSTTSPGGYVTMSWVAENNAFECDIPRGVFADETVTCVPMAVEVEKDGTIVSTLRFNAYVDQAILKATGTDPDPLEEWHDAISNLEDYGLTIGTVTTLDAGKDATASITGKPPAQKLNLGIPQGAKGDKGNTGTPTDYKVKSPLAYDGTTTSIADAATPQNPIHLADKTELNTLVTPGFYTQTYNETVLSGPLSSDATMSAYPKTLQVYRTGNTSAVQVLTYCDYGRPGANMMFIREGASGTGSNWNNWQRVNMTVPKNLTGGSDNDTGTFWSQTSGGCWNTIGFYDTNDQLSGQPSRYGDLISLMHYSDGTQMFISNAATPRLYLRRNSQQVLSDWFEVALKKETLASVTTSNEFTGTGTSSDPITLLDMTLLSGTESLSGATIAYEVRYVGGLVNVMMSVTGTLTAAVSNQVITLGVLAEGYRPPVPILRAVWANLKPTAYSHTLSVEDDGRILVNIYETLSSGQSLNHGASITFAPAKLAAAAAIAENDTVEDVIMPVDNTTAYVDEVSDDTIETPQIDPPVETELS